MKRITVLGIVGCAVVLLAQEKARPTRAAIAALVAATTVRPEARAQTVPTPHTGDAADDPAIWIHPQNPELSIVLGTDKQGGLHSYNMDGSALGLVSDGCQPNNVDVLYGFPLDGRKVDIAMAGVRAPKNMGVKIWAIDAATRKLTDVSDGGNIRVLDGVEPYGSCSYHSARTGKFYFFVNDKSGRVEQYELSDAGGGKIKGTKVRTLKVRSLVEGCTADDDLGFFYLSEETVGIWKFGAEPDAGREGKLIARIGDHGLTADAEGLTIYYATGERGYLIASSQGNNTFKVYERGGDNRYVFTIDPKGGRIDDVNDTDGICVTSCPTSKQFGKGVFIVQDGANAGGNQNFKLYGWEDIAGTNLLIDLNWQPRGAAR